MYCEADILLVDLTDHAVNSIFAWLVIRIQQAVRVSVETLSSELLLKTRGSHLKARIGGMNTMWNRLNSRTYQCAT